MVVFLDIDKFITRKDLKSLLKKPSGHGKEHTLYLQENVTTVILVLTQTPEFQIILSFLVTDK